MKSQALIPLKIFKTDTDKNGTEILKMSDFYGDYFDLAKSNAFKTGKLSNAKTNQMIINDIGILNELVLYGKAVLTSGETLVADMDNLDPIIKKKLAAGIYKVAESRQVDGNLRAVIINEKNIRVKDITLKAAKLNPVSAANVLLMFQMRTLQRSIDDLTSLQKYSISLERRAAFITPFLEARDEILQLQESKSHLNASISSIQKSLNKGRLALYGDMKDLADGLLPETNKFFIYRRQSLIDKYSSMLLQDLQLANKYYGVHMQLLDYFGMNWEAADITNKYKYMLDWFFVKPLESSKQSLSMLLQANVRYNKATLNQWFYITEGVRNQLYPTKSYLKEAETVYLKEEIAYG